VSGTIRGQEDKQTRTDTLALPTHPVWPIALQRGRSPGSRRPIAMYWQLSLPSRTACLSLFSGVQQDSDVDYSCGGSQSVSLCSLLIRIRNRAERAGYRKAGPGNKHRQFDLSDSGKPATISTTESHSRANPWCSKPASSQY